MTSLETVNGPLQISRTERFGVLEQRAIRAALLLIEAHHVGGLPTNLPESTSPTDSGVMQVARCGRRPSMLSARLPFRAAEHLFRQLKS